MGGQGESLDATASTNTAGQNIVGVKVVTTLKTKMIMFDSKVKVLYSGYVFSSEVCKSLNTMSHGAVSSWLKVLYLQVLEVQVSPVLVSGLVSTMTVGDDGVQQLLEDLIGLLITSDAANGHDEGVT